jgi:hypothetical protein
VNDGLADHGVAVVVAVHVSVKHEENWMIIENHLKIMKAIWK